MFKEKEFRHESYGVVQFSRLSNNGRTRLFGSSITQHMTTIELCISEGVLFHSLSEDRFSDAGGKEILRVELSAAQFAELLTTMNMGCGVPCTIRRREGKQVANPPDIETEVERVRTGFKDRNAEFTTRLAKKAVEIDEILEKKMLNKDDRKAIKWAFKEVVQEVQSNMPFVLDQFQEAADRVVTAGKAEIDSFVTNMIQKTGIKQLAQVSENHTAFKAHKEEEE